MISHSLGGKYPIVDLICGRKLAWILHFCGELLTFYQWKSTRNQSIDSESRDKKNKQLPEIFRPISDHVFFRKWRKEDVIFAVNAKSPDPQDKAIANQLWLTIESLKSTAEKLPLRWYGLELELEKEALEERRLVFPRDECLQIARPLHFPSDKALDAALMYLDKLNIFLYYPSVLPTGRWSV